MGVGKERERAQNELVSLIIVLYNSSNYVEACLRSVAVLEYEPIEVILVDNASTDDSVLMSRSLMKELRLKGVVSLLNRNRGFAAASNRGALTSSGDILFFLNPDTEVFPDSLSALVRALRDERVGVAGCKVYCPDRKTLQHAGGFIRDNGLTMHYGFNEIDTGQYEDARDVAYVTGAAMAMRKRVFEKAGGFDTGYFPAYFEETDLCLRVRRLGYRVLYVPEARVVHHESTTTGRFTRSYYYLYHKNRIRFILKNFSAGFIFQRALPMEEKWIGLIDPADQALPLNNAYFVNLLKLPLTILDRARTERTIGAPRIEDTVSEI